LIYNNLIYFLVVILILTTTSVPDQPQIFPSLAASIFILKALSFKLLLEKIFSSRNVQSATQYATAERKGSILAIVLFSCDVYLLDSPHYFSKLPLATTLPVVNSFFSLLLFTLYLSLMWLAAKPRYQLIFGRSHTRGSFILSNLKTNLPIVLPWLILSLFADLLQNSSIKIIKDILNSAWGEPVIFLIFFAVLIVFFPFFITKLWDCTPLPPGPVRSRIEDYCTKEKVKYADIMLWPLFEGQALTAGVMGLTSRFRYLLVTPALLSSLTPKEIEAVMAHEVGHVQKKHLQLYLVLFLGFGIIAQLFSYPILYLLTDSDLFYKMVHFANKEPGNALALASTIPMFVLMIVYFRYIMGFFMRNFERQADLHALKAMKTSAPLVSVFEKIAILSGNIRDLPSWHHFGIGQRIDFLQMTDKNPSLIKKHDQKTYDE